MESVIYIRIYLNCSLSSVNETRGVLSPHSPFFRPIFCCFGAPLERIRDQVGLEHFPLPNQPSFHPGELSLAPGGAHPLPLLLSLCHSVAPVRRFLPFPLLTSWYSFQNGRSLSRNLLALLGFLCCGGGCQRAAGGSYSLLRGMLRMIFQSSLFGFPDLGIIGAPSPRRPPPPGFAARAQGGSSGSLSLVPFGSSRGLSGPLNSIGLFANSWNGGN